MRQNDYQDARDRELLAVYREKLLACTHINLNAIFREVSESPASRFWISEKSALEEMYYIRKNGTTSRRSANYKEMAYEIYRRVCSIMDRRPSMTMKDAVEYVVQRPAPKFYLTPKTIKFIIWRAKKRLLEEKKRKLRFLL